MFDNIVKVAWPEGEERVMVLLETVRFTDKAGKVWEAPAGSRIDGASIPKFFWRVIGSPFIGLYRRPSVIHDVYCETRSEPYEAVHAVFNEMMECEGLSDKKRIAMFEAVDHFGPKWDNNMQDLTVSTEMDNLL